MSEALERNLEALDLTPEALDLEPQTDADLFNPTCLGVLRREDGLVLVEASSVKELKEKLSKYPPESVVAVWKGKKLKLKAEVKTMIRFE